MKRPEEILAKHGYPMPGDDLDLNLVKAMEEYKNQFIDFDGPLAGVDHYQKLARNWEDAHAKLEEKLRMQYDAEFEAFKVSFEQRTRNDFEQQLNEAIHADASEITELRKDVEARDRTIDRLENDLSEAVEIMSSIYHNVDKYHLNISFKNGELYDKLKDYLGT
jgi:predicted RNase H-like nuclease (RuvC/YqgF family)